MSGVRRYEWVRTGMAEVADKSTTIPWCEPAYFVNADDYDALLREREEFLQQRALLSAALTNTAKALYQAMDYVDQDRMLPSHLDQVRNELINAGFVLGETKRSKVPV